MAHFFWCSRELIIAIDSSFSMNHGQFQSRFDLAKKHAFEAVKSLPLGKFSMVVMGGEPDVIFRHSDPDLDTLEQRLDSLKVHPVALPLDNALSAVESLLESRILPTKSPVPHRRTKANLGKSLSRNSTVCGIAEDGCNFSCAAL